MATPSHRSLDAHSDGPTSDPLLLRPEGPLIGGEGQEYVQAVLSSNEPQSAIRQIQRNGALRSPAAAALLGLLDQLGASRSDSHRAVLEAARARLLARIPALAPEACLALLDASFQFIALAELRAVPLACLDRLAPVPAGYLKQLAADRDLFGDLPPGVQRQVWELDRKLLQHHAAPLVGLYLADPNLLWRNLDMDECLPPPPPGHRHAGDTGVVQRLPTKMRRNVNSAIKKLREMIGSSPKVYKGVVELIVSKLRDSEGLYLGLKETALCSLRSQLLMALHDAGATQLCSQEACHKLAWALDACVNDRSLNERRLRELHLFFAQHTQQRAPPAAKGPHRRPAGGRNPGGVPTNISGSRAEDPLRVLADAGMVLRDPSTMHLLLHQVIRRLEAVTAAERTPRDDEDLCFLTRLLQLATAARQQLRERRYAFPPVSMEVVQDLYPIIATFITDAELADPADPDAPLPDSGPHERLTQLLSKDEIVRKV